VRPSGTESLVRVMIEGEGDITAQAEGLAEVIRKNLI
jgi:phosphomannomutase